MNRELRDRLVDDALRRWCDTTLDAATTTDLRLARDRQAAWIDLKKGFTNV
ncbi:MULTISPECIES: hypothetical protein [Dietzia]|uniref:hypothetical protein n=1 Tax=Dietzia TaxID=37914 RepID=UPI0015FBA96E|nr:MULTISPECIES: hypothetical protein [Dietzia]MBB1030682.1 hypothetical protein [Dietzia sp. SLG310A2-38A2]MCT1639202.1 hypothetical protein [Dietzia cinnamea]MCT2173259.1 hypothetical protein [Dietzia cinnamea]